MGGGDVVGTAIVNLKANTSGFMSEISKAFSGIGKEANGMSGMMKGAGGMMTAGITAPIVAGAAFAVKSFQTINDAEVGLIRQTNTTGAAADGLRKSFTNVLGTVPQDAATVSSTMTVVSNRLHITGTELETVTKKGLDMSRMLGVDSVGAVTGVTKAMNAFQIPASQADATMDKLYVVATKTGVPLNDLTGTLAKAGAIASSAKVPMEGYTAVIGALGASGTPAKQGVSILNDSVTKLQASLGKQDVGNEWNAMMQRIASGTATAADKTLLGQKNYDKLSISLGNTKTGYDALKKAQDGSAGSIEKQSDATMTLSEKLDEFKNKAEVAFAPFGKVLINVLETALDAAKPILDILTTIMGVFSTMPAPVQMVVVGILGILAAIGPILMIIGPLSAGFAIIAPIVTGIGATLMTTVLPAILAISTPVLIMLAVFIAIGIAIYLLYTYFKPFHDAVNQVVGWVKTLVGDLMSGNFGKLGDDFKKGIMGAIDALKKVDWGGIAKQFLAALLGIPSQFMSALQKLDWGGFAQSIITFLTTDVPQFLNSVKNLDWGGFARAVIMDLIGVDILFWQSIMNLDWGGFANTVINDIVNLVGNVYNAFIGLDWGGLANTIINDITNLAGNLLNAFLNLDWGSLGNSIAGAIGNALHSVSFDTHIPGIGVVTLQHGGYVPEDTLAMIHAGEYVVPASGVSGGLPAIGSHTSASTTAKSTTTQGHTFNITFNNATLTTQQEADKLSRQLAFKTTEYLRRAGHSRG